MDARVEQPRIDPAAWEGLEELREGLRAFLAKRPAKFRRPSPLINEPLSLIRVMRTSG